MATHPVHPASPVFCVLKYLIRKISFKSFLSPQFILLFVRFHVLGTAGGRGGQGGRVSNNVYYNADNDVLYPAASMGVKRRKGKSMDMTDVSTGFLNVLHVCG